MKKFLTIIAIALVAATLFVGCENLSFLPSGLVEPQPVRHNYEHYGFSFEVIGDVTENGGNKYGYATLSTNIGQFLFMKKDIPSDSTIHTAHQIALKAATELEQVDEVSVRILRNGASFFVSDPVTLEDGSNIMRAYCFLQYGESVWIIVCGAPVDNFNQPLIIEAFVSAEFY